VQDYLARTHDISRSRMTAVGYGFSRPKAPNDPVNGNPVNRRVEIYIRPSDHKAAVESTVAPFGVGTGEPPTAAPAVRESPPVAPSAPEASGSVPRAVAVPPAPPPAAAPPSEAGEPDTKPPAAVP